MHERGFSLLRRTLAALVAVPHSAIAIGLVFLLAPSGWLIRILSPGITGFPTRLEPCSRPLWMGVNIWPDGKIHFCLW